jgi:hypothetical protein
MMVFIFCNLAWVFFRAESITDALFVLMALGKSTVDLSQFFSTSVTGLTKVNLCYILFTIAVLSGVDYAATKTDVIEWISDKNKVIRWMIYLVMIWMILFFMPSKGTSEFVYFQF